MGQKDEENSASEDEGAAEKEKLRPNPTEDMEMTKIPIKVRDGHPEVIAGQDDPLIKSVHLRYLLIGFNGFVAVNICLFLCLTLSRMEISHEVVKVWSLLRISKESDTVISNKKFST